MHAPVTEPAASDYLQAREGEEVEITCIVHASPPAHVDWYHNGRLLAAKDTVTSVRGNKYTLIATPIGKKLLPSLALLFFPRLYLS